MPVPSAVLDAWGVAGHVDELEGGQGTSIRAGGLVLKPYADAALVAWHADLCDSLSPQGFRLPAPVASLDGRLVVAGWSATAFAEGSPVRDDDTSAASWLPVLDAGRAFHAAVDDRTRPPLLDARTDRWAGADRIAWSEAPAAGAGERSGPLLDAARELVVDEGLPAQLVHGDLSGNVLLHPTLPPAVIDVSPYWRPAAYADAVVVVDALLWWRADERLISLARPADLETTRWRSLLARAAVFRLLAFDEPSRTEVDVARELPRYDALLGLISDAPAQR
ncbi:MAG TPA: TIGR02569 family protein [Candidatus Nanopelagicales bacterium]|nr:TIGR02569 family protein [Candidatus Nanopelagicales bacterium]